MGYCFTALTIGLACLSYSKQINQRCEIVEEISHDRIYAYQNVLRGRGSMGDAERIERKYQRSILRESSGAIADSMEFGVKMTIQRIKLMKS